mgnify:CR=1 FL=1
MEEEERDLGKNDDQGVINIGKLNHYARDHSITFHNVGYERMNLVTRGLDGKHIGVIINNKSEKIAYHVTFTGSATVTQSNDDSIGNPKTRSESRTVTIPMPRK